MQNLQVSDDEINKLLRVLKMAEVWLPDHASQKDAALLRAEIGYQVGAISKENASFIRLRYELLER
ncbi:hypothetical protein [Paenibacillus lactis]|uniref:hypothetical protein n=1 Tax=Paenibacillus lactis TaxID=228574 RepID=UPI003D726D92